jgi:hypothetical protein
METLASFAGKGQSRRSTAHFARPVALHLPVDLQQVRARSKTDEGRLQRGLAVRGQLHDRDHTAAEDQ